MTTTVITRQTHITMLKQLVAGHDLEFVAAANHVPRQTVLDIVSNHGYPNKDRMAWAVDVLIQGGDKIPTGQLSTGTPLDEPTPAAVAHAQSTVQRPNGFALTPAPAITHVPPAGISILVQAEQSPFIRTQNIGAKISALLADLTTRLNDEQAAVEAKASADREAARIASRIATLQAEIDKLRRKPTKAAKAATGQVSSSAGQATPDSAVIRSWAWANNIDCPKTGAVNKAIRDAYHAAHTAGAA